VSQGIVPAVPRGQQIAQGLLSGSTLLLVAVGVPVVLVLVGGSPVPHGLVHAVRVDMSLRQLFGKPVADTWMVHAAFALAWCAWLWLSVCVVVEMVSWVSGRNPVRVPGSRAMQAVAACLVGTTLAVMSANRMPGPSTHASARASVAASSSAAPARTNARSPRFASTPVKTPPGTHVAEKGTTSPEVENRSTRTNPNLLRPRSRAGAFRSGADVANGSTTDLPIVWPSDRIERSSDLVERSSAGSGSEVTEESSELADVVGAAAASPVRTYVVQPHDTLWSIAGSQLGSPLLWPEIAQANYGRPQPDGRVLTDAHWIDPGWVLIIPPDAPAADAASPSPMSTPAAPAAVPPPSAPVEPTPTTTPPPTPTTLPAPAAAAQTPATAAPTPTTVAPSPTSGMSPSSSVSRGSRAQAVQVGTAHLVRRQDTTPDGQAGERHGGLPLTPIGAGLLGAGLVGIIDRMRRAQQRHRRVGEHIRLPHPALSSLERRLRISDDPLAPCAVDAALRTFASGSSTASPRTSTASAARRPVVAGVQVHPDDIELVPEDDGWTGTVPGPFESRLGSSSWFVARRLLTWPDPGDTDGSCDDEAPCPALVTVGRSDAGPCLVNLEAMGSLAVSGEPAACDGLLRALALELATSFWADQFDLVLVGFGHELSRFERVRVVSDASALVRELEHRGSDGRSLLHTAGYRSFSEARMAAGSDTWDALVVLCGPFVSPSEAQALVDQAGDAETGLSVVVCGDRGGTRHRLTVDGPGSSSPLDLLGTVVWPQRVESSELEGLGRLVNTAADLSSVPASVAPYASISAPLPQVPPEPADRSKQWVGADDSDAPTSPLRRASERLGTDWPEQSDVDMRDSGVGFGAASSQESDLASMDVTEVEVLVLGVVEIRGNARQFTRAWAKELVVYLAMHPGGVSNEAWATALWPDRLMAPSSLHSTASVARRSLGQARDGGDHLPKGHGRLVLANTVGTDWDRFVRLADSGQASHWRAAMELVRGRPFDGLRASDWPILEGLSAAIEASVVDVATRLASECLAARDPAGAEWAARRGLLVSPYDERLYRMLLRAADLAGNPAGVEAVMSELLHLVADGVEPFDSIHPETTDLYRTLTRRQSFAPSSR
jgi:nucleoid-associated protein YgaU/DNA-binding SARP family transcriptional activator